MANRLADETSPYLLQHADNPVDWWPWTDDAFAEARRRDVPVLLSVGYSACHWCHVMAHESFEDEATAALMNQLYVSIKVDREERPDVDAIYMQAVQAFSGQGGWPMTVFLTPEALPYFGGTYFPPERRHGLRSFREILRAAADAYHSRRDAVARTGEEVRNLLQPMSMSSGGAPTLEAVDAGIARLLEQVDREHGGFGGAPKFPHAAALDLLLRRFASTQQPELWNAAALSLDSMARGGVNDQLAGGFHRYSVDARWAVPHFEKMLYDSAQLAPVYLHAYQLRGEARFLNVATDTLDWIARDLRLPGGGFACALDADTEGVEGSTYVWSPAELEQVLGPDDAAFAAEWYGVTAEGNFEEAHTVLWQPRTIAQYAALRAVDEGDVSLQVESVRQRLLAAREARAQPQRDDKVLTSWNALAIAAFAEVGAATDRHDLLQVARQAATFLLEEVTAEGRLLRTWREGRARISGFLEDHALFADALLTLHAATGEGRWYREAERLAGEMLERFFTDDGFYDTPAGDGLLVRPRTVDDHPLPAGQSAAARALLRLYAADGDARWLGPATAVVSSMLPAVSHSPLAVATLAAATVTAATGPVEVAIAGEPTDPRTQALVAVVHQRYTPEVTLCWGDPSLPLLDGRGSLDGEPAAYVCRNFACHAPVTTPSALAAQLH